MKPETEAEIFLKGWIKKCRERNESRKIELKDVSNWAEKRLEINEDCLGLDSMDGIFILFCFGSLLNYGGGPYDGRTTEMKNKYEALISRKYNQDKKGKQFDDQRKKLFEAIDEKLKNLVQRFGEKKPLQNWWEDTKKKFNGNLENAAENIIREIHSWTYSPPKGKSPLFTVKAFWIPRELHANDIWPDFPVKYCCVPDSRVRKTLKDIYGHEKFRELFGKDCNDSSFNLNSSILMSKKIWELISTRKIDGHYPYDMPFFRRDAESIEKPEAISKSNREQKVKTWGGRSSFSYEGSVKVGTKISFGSASSINISANQYRKLLNHFRGRCVSCGTSRTKPPEGSLGQWLMENVTKTATASYIGRILVNEGYAEKIGTEIQFGN